MADISPLIGDIEQLNTQRLLRVAGRHGVPIPSSHDKRHEELWQESNYGYTKYLTTAGKHHIETAIRNERMAKRSELIWWIPPSVALLGAAISISSLREANKERIKAEGAYKLVRKIGEETAELTAFAALQVGRFASSDSLDTQLLQSKDRIVTILSEIGADKNRIFSIENRFIERIASDLKNKVNDAVWKAIDVALRKHMQEPPPYTMDINIIRTEAQRRLSLYSGSDKDRKDLIGYLNSQGITDQEIFDRLDDLDHFLKFHKLKVS